MFLKLEMILLILIGILVMPLSLYGIKTVQKKNKAVNKEKKFGNVGAVDLGFLGLTVVNPPFVWDCGAMFWDKTPPYEIVLDFLNKNKSRLMRFFRIVNWSGAADVVFVTDLDTVKDVLRSRTWLNRFHDGHDLHLGMFGKPLGIVGGNGLYWKEARNAVMTAFRQTNLLNAPRIEGLYLEEIQVLLDELRNRSSRGEDEATFSPQHLFDYPVIHVVFKILFGRRLKEKDPLEGKLMDQFNHYNSTFCFGFGILDLFPFLKYFQCVIPSARAYLRVCRTIYDITTFERDRRAKEKNHENSGPRDVMDSLLKTLDVQAESTHNYFTFENLLVTIRDLVLAGSDTTNTTLQHMILFVATHQEIQQKVYGEICSTVGHDRWPTYEDRKRMISTQAVLLETLRLGSIAPITCRINDKDCALGGLTMKKGTYIVPAYIAIHRSEDLWEDPLVFRPERFISQDGCIINTEKTLPFSYGPRACPGELNGRVALFMFTVILLREFKWELSDAHPTPSMLKGLRGITRAPLPYFVKISPRMNIPK